jgi:hypothetical protein
VRGAFPSDFGQNDPTAMRFIRRRRPGDDAERNGKSNGMGDL